MRLRRLVPVVALSCAVLVPVAAPADAAAARAFPNCKAMNKVYKHGVGKVGARDHVSSGKPVTTFKRSNALYAANTKRDGDKDGVACEKR